MSNKHRLQMQRRNIVMPQPKPKPQRTTIDRNIINFYTCRECGGSIITIDRDDGTTPMMLACRATLACDGTMFSSGYTCDQSLVPDHEWYKPAKLPKGEAREYVQMGGLLIRRIES